MEKKRLSPGGYDLVCRFIRERKNLLIGGGMGSGKSTFANAVLKKIVEYTPNDRFYIVEDVQELQCRSKDKTISLYRRKRRNGTKKKKSISRNFSSNKNMPITFSRLTGSKDFRFEPLSSSVPLTDFFCSVDEYNVYLYEDALRSGNDHIALTWLLRERSSGEIAAYMSLIADAIKLSIAEKELHNLNYPFKTIPAIKIAKLAVSQIYHEKYNGIGSFMIDSAELLALDCNRDYCVGRFLTVDTVIEHNEGVRTFYEKKLSLEQRTL